MNREYKNNPFLFILFVVGFIVRIYIYSIFLFQPRFLIQPLIMFGRLIPYIIFFMLFIFGMIGWLMVYTDAENISAGKAFVKENATNHLTWKPGSWAFLVFFLWSLAFPAYLIYRKKIFEINNRP